MAAATAAAAAAGPAAVAPDSRKASSATDGTVYGQITYRRAVSKRLVFYDLKRLCTSNLLSNVGSSSNGHSGPLFSSQEWVELVIKAGTFGAAQEVKDLRDRVKLGDWVAVSGQFEGSHVLLVQQLTITRPWRSQQAAGLAFTPQPAPHRHQKVAQHQQQLQLQQAPLVNQQQQLREQEQQEQKQEQQQQQQQKLQHDGLMAAESQAHQERIQQHQQQQQLHTQHFERDGVAAASMHSPNTVGAAVESDWNALMPAVLQQPSIPPAANDVSQQPDAGAGPGAIAVVQPPQLAVCKFWVNTGRCAKGAACPYAHLQSAVLPTARNTWLKQHKGRRQLLSSLQGFTHTDSAASKQHRAQRFAAWLVETYGRERLNSGSGVLDIAGGAGGLTFELAAAHNIRCTLVDPRPLKLNKAQLKYLQQAGQQAVLSTTTAMHLTAELAVQHTPEGDSPAGSDVQQQQQQQQQQQLCKWQQQQCKQQQQSAQTIRQQVQQQLQLNAQSRSSLQQSTAQPLHVHQLQGWFGAELWRSSVWEQGRYDDCSLVVGLHPDQATEAILQYAVSKAKPFAIVPCCVFPRLFPHRQLVAEGQQAAQRVETYSQLVHYLQQEGQGQLHTLDVEGANIVVFRQ